MATEEETRKTVPVKERKERGRKTKEGKGEKRSVDQGRRKEKEGKNKRERKSWRRKKKGEMLIKKEEKGGKR